MYYNHFQFLQMITSMPTIFASWYCTHSQTATPISNFKPTLEYGAVWQAAAA